MPDEFKHFVASKLKVSKTTKKPSVLDLEILIQEYADTLVPKWNFDNNQKINIKSFRPSIKDKQGSIQFLVRCLESTVSSQGETIHEAMENLKKALKLHFEDVAKS